jgi:chromosomal replication initiator protein
MVHVVMQLPAGFKRFVDLPENRSALAACQELSRLAMAGSSRPLRTGDLLYLHGPAGVGKSCLVAALIEEVCGHGPELTSFVLSGNDFPLPWDKNETARAAERFVEACGCDLLVVEDLQHLPDRATETLIQLLDERSHHGLATVFTASAGPAQLAHRGHPLPVRLTNRLASGLVVAMQPLQIPSRRQFLQELARRRGLEIADEVLSWLAESLSGGGRQLEGALHQIEALAALDGKALTLDMVREQFQVQVEAAKPTVERIVHRVSEYYRVEPRQLKSARRLRHLMLPRQISMYLARQLTPLSLQQIGACFGGRDHSTVLYAFRKVEEAIQNDVALSSAVQQIHAELA